jgi:translation initiation factor 1 (eIF-1/SUI1)
MGRKGRRRDQPSSGEESTNGGLGGFAALLQAKGLSASAAASEPVPQPVVEAAPTLLWSSLGKIVLRKERKGRRGKTVTLIEGVPELHLVEACGQLKRGLGTGAHVEDEALVLQGDLRERCRAWLTAAGVSTVRG